MVSARMSGKLSAFFFMVATASGQPAKGPSTVLECATLSEGLGLGHDDSAMRRGWMEKVEDKDCSYFRLAYPAGLAWGAMFITAGPVVPTNRQVLDYSTYEYFQLEMKGERGNENVVTGLKTDRDPDDGSESRASVLGISTSWQWFTFPLSRFPSRRAGESLSDRLKNLYVITELVFDGREARTVYLRRVRFGPAQPSLRSALNAATNLLGQPIAPGELLSLYGSDLGPVSPSVCPVDSNRNAPTICGDTRVTFDGLPAPLLYISNSQINVQVPYEVAKNPRTKVRVLYGQSTSNELDLLVSPSVPGIFDIAGRALALNEDGTINSPDVPALRGRIIVLYATGAGETVPSSVTGQPCSASALTKPIAPASLRIGGRESTIVYAGCAPSYIGLLQVNAQIAPDATTGLAPVFLTVGSSTSQTGVFVYVK